jgi:hypothetical protein
VGGNGGIFPGLVYDSGGQLAFPTNRAPCSVLVEEVFVLIECAGWEVRRPSKGVNVRTRERSKRTRKA